MGQHASPGSSSDGALPKPRNRSQLRLHLGQWYYSIRRYWTWYFSRVNYAVEQLPPNAQTELCPYEVVSHQSPLLRRLKDVDLWLQFNKVHNLRLAVQTLDGLVLYPGQTLSLWRRIGRPSKRKGYKPGMVLVNGGFRAGTGGGLCQLSNLIYWMTLHTPLTVVERYRHQYDVFPDANRTLPFGSGATIAYNYIDLQVRNDTNQPFVLRLHLTEADLVGQWNTSQPFRVSYQVYEQGHTISQSTGGWYLRHNQIWRDAFDDEGHLLDSQCVAQNHAVMMYSPLLAPPTDTHTDAGQGTDTGPHTEAGQGADAGPHTGAQQGTDTESHRRWTRHG